MHCPVIPRRLCVAVHCSAVPGALCRVSECCSRGLISAVDTKGSDHQKATHTSSAGAWAHEFGNEGGGARRLAASRTVFHAVDDKVPEACRTFCF